MNILGPLLIALGCLIVICTLLYGLVWVRLQSQRETQRWVAAQMKERFDAEIDHAIVFGTGKDELKKIRVAMGRFGTEELDIYGPRGWEHLPPTDYNFEQLADIGEAKSNAHRASDFVMEANRIIRGIINRSTRK